MNDLDNFGIDVPKLPAPTPLDDVSLDGEGKKARKEEDDSRPTIVQWSSHGPNTSIGVGRTYPTLEPGVYTPSNDRGTPIFIKREINVDEFLEFPDSKSDAILKEITEFWKRGHLFKEFGFLHRRGFLLWGPPGGGKTIIIQQTIKRIVDDKGIVFICGHPRILEEALAVFREVEPNRQVVCVFEDIDSIIHQWGEDTLLSLLDGEAQINKVLNVASTNYPEKLDRRIVARPRRFDKVIKIGMPEEKVRKMYFTKKLNIKDKEVEKWVKSTENFSFAAMAELVISVKCLGNSFEESVKNIKKLMDAKPSSEDFGGSIGFTS